MSKSFFVQEFTRVFQRHCFALTAKPVKLLAACLYDYLQEGDYKSDFQRNCGLRVCVDDYLVEAGIGRNQFAFSTLLRVIDILGGDVDKGKKKEP